MKQKKCLICHHMELKSNDENSRYFCKMCGMNIRDDKEHETLKFGEETFHFCCKRCMGYYRVIRKNLGELLSRGEITKEEFEIVYNSKVVI